MSSMQRQQRDRARMNPGRNVRIDDRQRISGHDIFGDAAEEPAASDEREGAERQVQSEMLNHIIAIYLILIGLLGLFGGGNIRLR